MDADVEFGVCALGDDERHIPAELELDARIRSGLDLDVDLALAVVEGPAVRVADAPDELLAVALGVGALHANVRAKEIHPDGIGANWWYSFSLKIKKELVEVLAFGYHICFC